jgi:hypothetical protein
MPIPPISFPVPTTLRRVYTKSGGFQLPNIASIPVRLSQGTPNDPAVPQVQIVRGTGSLDIDTAQYLGQDTLDVLVPIVGIDTPFKPSQPLTLSPEPPIVSLPTGVAVSSVTVTPHIKNTLAGGKAFAAKTLSPGTTARQFLARVQVRLTQPIRTMGTISLNVAVNLHA